MGISQDHPGQASQNLRPAFRCWENPLTPMSSPAKTVKLEPPPARPAGVWPRRLMGAGVSLAVGIGGVALLMLFPQGLADKGGPWFLLVGIVMAVRCLAGYED